MKEKILSQAIEFTLKLEEFLTIGINKLKSLTSLKRLLILSVMLFCLGEVSMVYGDDDGGVNMNAANVEKATFAGGCFWCMQPPFDKLDGVVSTFVGYIGGQTDEPTYEEVCSGRTGHAEAVQIVFDPTKITYKELVNVFWRNINPTTLNSQFADRGSQYRTAIFYHSDEQKKLAIISKDELQKSGKFDKPIVTEITEAKEFFRGEDYHQKYYEKDSYRYKMYKQGSGRAGYLKETWGE